MKLLQNVFLAIFLCVGTGANAQIPGYMGKRLFFNAEFQFMPSINWMFGTGLDVPFSLNTRYGLGAGYAISRTQTLMAQVQYSKTGMYSYLYSASGAFGADVFCKLSTAVLDLSYSSCRASRGDIAPIGKQTAYHLYVMRASGKGNLYRSNTPVAESAYNIDPTGIAFGVGYSLTYNKVINDKFMLQYGWRLNLPLSWGSGELLGGTNQETFDNDLKYRLRYDNLLQFKVGIALLN